LIQEVRQPPKLVHPEDPLIRTAVLGQLGQQEEAQKAKGGLLALIPDLDARGRSLIKRMLFQDEHVEMILDGLKIAGLELGR
jgi:hypothetical protein